jgi:hypothetical protein
MDKSMQAEVLPLSVSSLKIRQVKSLRIHLLRVAPRSALPTSIKSITTGAALKVLAALASGDGDRLPEPNLARNNTTMPAPLDPPPSSERRDIIPKFELPHWLSAKLSFHLVDAASADSRIHVMLLL